MGKAVLVLSGYLPGAEISSRQILHSSCAAEVYHAGRKRETSVSVELHEMTRIPSVQVLWSQ
jgi:hypothetical protein